MTTLPTLPIQYGGTGATTAQGARTSLSINDDMFRYRNNVLRNSVMRVAERGASITGTLNGYTLDGWALSSNTTAAVTITQDTDVPTILTDTPYEIPYSFKLDVTTADTTIGSTDYFNIYQSIEGYFWKELAHKPLMLSFWAKTNRSGGAVISPFLRVSGSPTLYNWGHDCAIDSTWRRFVIPISASGVWGEANTISGGATFILALLTGNGVYSTSSLDTWVSGNIFQTPNTTNMLDSTANDFWITDIRLHDCLVDLQTPPLNFMDDWIFNRRYFRKFQAQGAGAYDAMTLGGAFYTNQGFATQDLSNMRATGGTLAAVNPTQMYVHCPGYTNVVCTNVYGQSWAGTVGVWGVQYTASIGAPVAWAGWLTGQGSYTTCYLTASCEI